MCTVKIGRLGKFDLNPRGEVWCKDENRFGHKLLSKFGWSRGKGLGKNEDGIAENLKVRMKIGNTGVGWDEKLPIGIHYHEYNAVLEDLSKRFQKPGEIKSEDISLEKRSQEFKNRIHYQKFVRGKDISQYSEKDMSCIFLSRKPEKKTESTLKESVVTNVESRPNDSSAKESVPTFNSQLSIADYFALKMKNKIGSKLDSSKESKSNEEFSQSKADVISKKRKRELKSSQRAKRMKLEPEVSTVEESLSSAEENILESSNSSKEDSNEQFENIEESYNNERVKKKKRMNKKIKKLCKPSKVTQDIENNWPEEKNVIKENSTENENMDFVWSQENSPNSVELESISEEITSKTKKPKKKCSKKTKKYCLEEASISTTVEKFSSLNESDDVGKNCSEKCTTKNVKTEKQSSKESKKLKNKASNLKSCLKSRLSNNKYSLKEKRNVSFCENISYKIIENVLNNIVLETNEQLLCSDDDSEAVNETESIETTQVDNSSSSVKSSEDDEHNDENPADSDVPECFKLPKNSSKNYDSWLETQRIAARMKLYKNMGKKMKRHRILRKTNLLEIKGYGNWGL